MKNEDLFGYKPFTDWMYEQMKRAHPLDLATLTREARARFQDDPKFVEFVIRIGTNLAIEEIFDECARRATR